MTHWHKPTEADLQRTVIQWARIASSQTVELTMLVHVANEGKRTPRSGKILKDLGMSPGFPDLVLFVPRGGYHGLAIEMKTQTGRVSELQELWLDRLADQGYRTAVCRGSESAIDTILRYLRSGGSHDTHDYGSGTGPAPPPARA